MGDPRQSHGEGGGKLILFGEHAVVYGVPAVVASLGTGVTAVAEPADFSSLTLHDGRTGDELVCVERGEQGSLSSSFSNILDELAFEGAVSARAAVHLPVGAGLGSSAALAVAVARAVGALCDATNEQIAAAVARSERVFHGEPSGIDETAALRGGMFAFRRTDGEPEIRPLATSGLRVLVCLAQDGASTAEMVAGVRAFHQRHPVVAGRLDDAIGEVVDVGLRALQNGAHGTVGEMMDVNHGLLASLGVSTPALNRACDIARSAGASGAKLTGAGGGGCVFAVASAERETDVLDAWAADGLLTYTFDI